MLGVKFCECMDPKPDLVYSAQYHNCGRESFNGPDNFVGFHHQHFAIRENACSFSAACAKTTKRDKPGDAATSPTVQMGVKPKRHIAGGENLTMFVTF